MLSHIDLEQEVNLSLTSCDLEYLEGQQNLIPASSHYPLSLEEPALDNFSAPINMKNVRTDQTPLSYVLSSKSCITLPLPDVP